ncbi:hypothetical protein FJ988_05855 [Mesorhizobium sp. CU3]|nr:hypothetical protein FJ988_05855 [Mesorhizobium sp. CU3]
MAFDPELRRKQIERPIGTGSAMLPDGPSGTSHFKDGIKASKSFLALTMRRIPAVTTMCPAAMPLTVVELQSDASFRLGGNSKQRSSQ